MIDIYSTFSFQRAIALNDRKTNKLHKIALKYSYADGDQPSIMRERYKLIQTKQLRKELEVKMSMKENKMFRIARVRNAYDIGIEK